MKKNRKIKKIVLIGFFVSGIASCTKDYSCTCTSYYNGVQNEELDVTTYLNTSKGVAKENCIGHESQDGTYRSECELTVRK